MNLYLITFQSGLNKMESVYDFHKDLFVEIEKYFTLHLIHYKEVETIPEVLLQSLFQSLLLIMPFSPFFFSGKNSYPTL